MKNVIFIFSLFAIVLTAGNAYAPLVLKIDPSKVSSSSGSSDTSTVDLSDKDTSKPVRSLK